MFSRTHTVDKAVAPLLKALRDLNLVSEERSKTIDYNDADIEMLKAENVLADTERARADRIYKALSDILDPKE